MQSTSSCLIPWPVLEPVSAMHDGQGAQQPFSIFYVNGRVSMLMYIKASHVHTSALQRNLGPTKRHNALHCILSSLSDSTL